MSKTNYVFSTTKTVNYRFPTHTNNLVMDRSEAQRCEAFLSVLEPGQAPPLHKHGEYEQIFYVMEGQGQLRIGEDSPQYFTIRPGDVVHIPVETWHAVTCEGNQKLVYLALDIFIDAPPADEPTFDSHVQAICRNYGWSYDEVTGKAAA